MIAILNNTKLDIIIEVDLDKFLIEKYKLAFFDYKFVDIIENGMKILKDNVIKLKYKLNDQISEYIYNSFFYDELEENIESLRNKIIITKDIRLPNDKNLAHGIKKGFSPVKCNEKILYRPVNNSIYLDSDGKYLYLNDINHLIDIDNINSLKSSKNSILIRIIESKFIRCIKDIDNDDISIRLGSLAKILDIKIEDE